MPSRASDIGSSQLLDLALQAGDFEVFVGDELEVFADEGAGLFHVILLTPVVDRRHQTVLRFAHRAITPWSETMTEELWIGCPYAETKRLVADSYSKGVPETGLRVYKSSPNGITVQWRVKAKSGQPGTGTITHGSLQIEEARELARYILSNWGTLSDIDTVQAAHAVEAA